MNTDTKIINEIISSQALNGMLLLSALDITPSQIAAIQNGTASLRTAERMLLSILIKKPDALDFSATQEGEFPFSITAWRNALESYDQQIEDLIDEMRKLQKKSGRSMKDFIAGTRNNNVHRRRVYEFFMDLHEKDLMGESAARNYQTSFWRSVETGQAFKRSSFLNK